MRLEVNYTDLEDDLDDVLDNILSPKSNDEIQIQITKIWEYLEVYNSQYITFDSKEKKEKIIWFFYQLAEIALVNSGHVILQIDEQKKTAELRYKGKNIIKTGDETDITGIIFSAIFHIYDYVSINHEDDFFTIIIRENLIKKVKTNYKDQLLAQMKKNMRNNKSAKDNTEEVN